LSRGKQAAEQELASAQKKVDERECQLFNVTATGVAYAVAPPLKSHVPNLDPGLLEKNFKCATETDRES
jgi:hypothetical protein